MERSIFGVIYQVHTVKCEKSMELLSCKDKVFHPLKSHGIIRETYGLQVVFCSHHKSWLLLNQLIAFSADKTPLA